MTQYILNGASMTVATTVTGKTMTAMAKYRSCGGSNLIDNE
jgi:hypothetical protein